MTSISDALQAILARISAAEAATGRVSDTVKLLAVSKAHPATAVREAFMAGQVLFGENYVQEALNKQAELADLAIEWHFVGPIQSNKTQAIAEHFSWVHGVDRLKIAERLNAARPANLSPLQICIQVNVSGESSKSGVNAQDLLPLAHAILPLANLRLRGLMAIPAPSTNPAEQRAQFAAVHALYVELNAGLHGHGHTLDTLSMGMSGDFPAAIAEGATIIRVGSAIFGARLPKNQGDGASQ